MKISLISWLYLNGLSKWEGEPFQFMITYLPSNGVYEKDGDKQIRADGQDKTHTCTQLFISEELQVLAESQIVFLSIKRFKHSTASQ